MTGTGEDLGLFELSSSSLSGFVKSYLLPNLGVIFCDKL